MQINADWLILFLVHWGSPQGVITLQISYSAIKNILKSVGTVTETK